MKQLRLYILSCIVIGCACNTPQKQAAEAADAATQVKASREMEDKINSVAAQLHRDCDSNLLQAALYKADSIRKATPVKKAPVAPAKKAGTKKK